MHKKLLSVILSVGLITGIEIVGVGSASAAPKHKPSPSSVRKLTPSPTSLTVVRPKQSPVAVTTSRFPVRLVDSWGNSAGKYFSGVGMGTVIWGVVKLLRACPVCILAVLP
ncbi:MAG: hypothetical protein Q7R42_00985 [Candidatus Planktophila sp.]|nr:hypothetical protein [Candidatus Planktophila sp.]